MPYLSVSLSTQNSEKDQREHVVLGLLVVKTWQDLIMVHFNSQGAI